jgi:hypothetical protein
MPVKHDGKAGCKQDTAPQISSYRKLPELYLTAVQGDFVAYLHGKLVKNVNKFRYLGNFKANKKSDYP